MGNRYRGPIAASSLTGHHMAEVWPERKTIPFQEAKEEISKDHRITVKIRMEWVAIKIKVLVKTKETITEINNDSNQAGPPLLKVIKCTSETLIQG